MDFIFVWPGLLLLRCSIESGYKEPFAVIQLYVIHLSFPSTPLCALLGFPVNPQVVLPWSTKIRWRAHHLCQWCTSHPFSGLMLVEVWHGVHSHPKMAILIILIGTLYWRYPISDKPTLGDWWKLQIDNHRAEWSSRFAGILPWKRESTAVNDQRPNSSLDIGRTPPFSTLVCSFHIFW